LFVIDWKIGFWFLYTLGERKTCLYVIRSRHRQIVRDGERTRMNDVTGVDVRVKGSDYFCNCQEEAEFHSSAKVLRPKAEAVSL
jgi:hypothetical protein